MENMILYNFCYRLYWGAVFVSKFVLYPPEAG